MRSVLAISAGRSDLGILRPILVASHGFKSLRISVASVSGEREPFRDLDLPGNCIENFKVERISSSKPHDVLSNTARILSALSDWFSRAKPDFVLLVGDRYETLGAGIAASILGIPLAHVHGGEVTVGAYDEAFRHSLTKMAHLHFASCEEHARRIRQLGEESWRVQVSGAPALIGIAGIKLMSKDELQREFGVDLDSTLLVTLHPTTLDLSDRSQQVRAVQVALDQFAGTVVVTAPNADSYSSEFAESFRAWVEKRPQQRVYVESLGTKKYFSFMNIAKAMVGNSSSGIIEAPQFKLPVVNIGRRQEGRYRADNVIDADFDATAIANALKRATSAAFSESISSLENPFFRSDGANVILQTICDAVVDERLLQKRFVDWDET